MAISLIRKAQWKKRINELLQYIATKKAEDITGWCLYNCYNDLDEETIVETCIYYYVSGRFEFTRSVTKNMINTEDIGLEGVCVCECEDAGHSVNIQSSGIVIEEKYLLNRILVHLDPKDFVVSYHPQLTEDEEVDEFVGQEMSHHIDEEDDEDEVSEQGVN